jgi:hypothetical protein
MAGPPATPAMARASAFVSACSCWRTAGFPEQRLLSRTARREGQSPGGECVRLALRPGPGGSDRRTERSGQQTRALWATSGREAGRERDLCTGLHSPGAPDQGRRRAAGAPDCRHHKSACLVMALPLEQEIRVDVVPPGHHRHQSAKAPSSPRRSAASVRPSTGADQDDPSLTSHRLWCPPILLVDTIKPRPEPLPPAIHHEQAVHTGRLRSRGTGRRDYSSVWRS